MLAKQRKVEVIRGTGKFVSPHEIEVDAADGAPRARSRSRTASSPRAPNRSACRACRTIRASSIPPARSSSICRKRMLVVGGGIIGLEMATVYDALGVKVSVVELTDGLMPGCDRDLVRPLEKRIAKRYERIMVEDQGHQGRSREGRTARDVRRRAGDRAAGLRQGAGRRRPQPERQATSAPKRPACWSTSAASFRSTGRCARTCRTSSRSATSPAQPMLAHKASHEGKLAAEVAHGEKRAFDARVIPSVAYTDPEIAWVGLTETDAKAKGIAYEKARFPWAASGRSLSLGRDDGMTKLLFDPATHRVIGGGIVGPNAGDLISEVALAIEMGSDAADLGLTIHPHPTLSETIMFAAEAFEGTLTDLYVPKKKT